MSVRDFDLLVVGGGTGRDVVLAGEQAGLNVALVERGEIGGTCHNRGCMATKMLMAILIGALLIFVSRKSPANEPVAAVAEAPARAGGPEPAPTPAGGGGGGA